VGGYFCFKARSTYEENYSVYEMPEEVEARAQSRDWTFLETSTRRLVGSIPVRDVKFDETRRKTMASEVLNRVGV
jgi:hypothetical protein